MPRTTLPNPLTDCHRCDGDLDRDGRVVSCADCDRWSLTQADPDAALDHFRLSEIVAHAREHPSECECVACVLARRTGNGSV